MNLRKLYTVFLLLFTLSSLASCVKSPTKTATNGQQKVQSNTTIKKVDARGFKTEVDGKKVQLVDVRTPREFTQGHLENAINYNIFDNDFTTKTEILDKSKPVYVYCRSGARSMNAAKNLKNRGYNVVNLNGGINGWMSKGFKIVK